MRFVRVRALVEHEGGVLFVQHPHRKAGVWVLPGGHVEHGESLADALSRELIEELGVAPVLGDIRYIHQLFLENGDQSLEFFFHVQNGADYSAIDLGVTSHGLHEIKALSFIDPSQETVLPDFLSSYWDDVQTHNWPKFEVRRVSSL